MFILFLLGMSYSNEVQIMGVSETENLVEVDLRKALLSFYLRPHAQHSLFIRKRDNGGGKYMMPIIMTWRIRLLEFLESENG